MTEILTYTLQIPYSELTPQQQHPHLANAVVSPAPSMSARRRLTERTRPV